MESPRFGIPIELAEDLSRGLGLTAAIETGTWRGDSAAQMAGVFEQVWTVELSPELHGAAVERHRGQPDIRFLQGESSSVLAELLPTVEGAALFWLDAHWGGSEGAGEQRQCPVLDEIAAIDSWRHAADSCILIDDARWFLGPPDPKLRREDWPTFLEVLDLLRAHHDRYVTILEDVVIAGPPACRQIIDAYWTKRQWEELEADRARLKRDVADLHDELDPPPWIAFRRLVKAILPAKVKERVMTSRARD